MVLAAAMFVGVVLDPAPALVQLMVRELDEVERSATWTASGSIVSNSVRYNDERSSVVR